MIRRNYAISKDYDMRIYFDIGDSVKCLKKGIDGKSLYMGKVAVVTKYFAVVKFEQVRESFSILDYWNNAIVRE